jgi:hypothetical protein
MHGSVLHAKICLFPCYGKIIATDPFEGNKSAWRFGVVSMPRLESAKGWWKEGMGTVCSLPMMAAAGSLPSMTRVNPRATCTF